MIQGKIVFFDGKKGFGFISDENGVNYFFHASQLPGTGRKTISQGTLVEFCTSESAKGLAAVNIFVIEEKQTSFRDKVINKQKVGDN